MRKPTRFIKLRRALEDNDIEIVRDLTCILNRSPAYVSDRMTAKREWGIEEAYRILDEIKIPHEQLHEYFPKGGASQ